MGRGCLYSRYLYPFSWLSFIFGKLEQVILEETGNFQQNMTVEAMNKVYAILSCILGMILASWHLWCFGKRMGWTKTEPARPQR
jgi:hypothetical protein